MTGPVSFNSGFGALKKIRIALSTRKLTTLSSCFFSVVWAIFFKNRIEEFLIPQRFASWYINSLKHLWKILMFLHAKSSWSGIFSGSSPTAVFGTTAESEQLPQCWSIFWCDPKYLHESHTYFTLQFILAYQRTLKIFLNLPLILTRNLGKKCVVF